MEHICEKCGGKFSNKYNLKKHEQKKIPCDRILKCGICLKIFQNTNHLQAHENRKKPCKLIIDINSVYDSVINIHSHNVYNLEKEKTKQLETINQNLIIEHELEKIKIAKQFPFDILVAPNSEQNLETKVEENSIEYLRAENKNLRAENKNKELRIQYLENKYMKKKPRTQYDEQWVIYIVINDALQLKSQVKIGIAKDLTDRLSTYNTSCLHSVIWYKCCSSEDNMNLLDRLIKKRLEHCQVQANREHYIGNVEYLICEIEKCFSFLEI